MKKKYLLITMAIVILVLFIISMIVNFGLNITLMANRKDAETMITELKDKFDTDYTLYQQLPTEQVSITSTDGLLLKGVYHNVYPTSNKVVILNHGYTANHYVGYQFTDVFFEEGYNVLLIDMRSHGDSAGDFASYGHYESQDMGLWVDWVKSRIGEDAYIGLHGQSMGAATVMLYAGTHPDSIKFVIEDCGFSSAKEVINFQFKASHVPFWPLYDLIRFKAKRLYNFDLSEVSPLEAISRSAVPTLFIHGTADTVIPYWMAQKLYDSKKGPKDRLYLVEGAAHMASYATNKAQYKTEVKDFLESL